MVSLTALHTQRTDSSPETREQTMAKRVTHGAVPGVPGRTEKKVKDAKSAGKAKTAKAQSPKACDVDGGGCS